MSEVSQIKSPFMKTSSLKENQQKIWIEEEEAGDIEQLPEQPPAELVEVNPTFDIENRNFSFAHVEGRIQTDKEQIQAAVTEEQDIYASSNQNIFGQKIDRPNSLQIDLSSNRDVAQLITENSNLHLENEKLRTAVVSMEKEIDNLKLSYKRVNFEGLKLRKANDLMKQNQKSTDIVLKNLRKELQDLKDKTKLQDNASETEDNQMLTELLKMLSKNDQQLKAVKELYKKYNKGHIFETDKKTGEQSRAAHKYENLKTYENLFEDSDAEDNEAESNHDFDKPVRIDNKTDKTVESVPKKEVETVNSPKRNDNFAVDVLQFRTAEDTIKETLNNAINLRKKNFTSQLTSNVDAENINIKKIINDLKVPINSTSNSPSITKSQIEEVVAYTQSYLESRKNFTSLRLTDHDKQTLMEKYSKKKVFDYKRMVKVIIEAVLEHVDFLESHIKGLTTKNSEMELKLVDIKAEMDYMLDENSKRNKDAQESLDSCYFKMKNSKLERKLSSGSENDELEKNRQPKSKTRKKSINEVAAVMDKKMSKKAKQTDKKQENRNQSRFKKPKNKNIKYKAKGDELAAFTSDSEESDENIWKRVTYFFTLQ